MEQRTPSLAFTDYLELEEHASVKHEYEQGTLVAMAGASDVHVTITGNVQAELRTRLRGGPCRVYSSDMKVQPVPGWTFYPDVVVTCDARDRTDRLLKRYPLLVVEVLSDSTEQRDRGTKWLAYRRCTTLQEYLLVAQDQRRVEIYRREGDLWTYRLFEDTETIPLASVACSISMDLLYENVEWPGDLPPEYNEET